MSAGPSNATTSGPSNATSAGPSNAKSNEADNSADSSEDESGSSSEDESTSSSDTSPLSSDYDTAPDDSAEDSDKDSDKEDGKDKEEEEEKSEYFSSVSQNVVVGRQRRPSKKQKRKRKELFRTTHLEELYNLGSLCDPADDIEKGFSSIPQDAEAVNIVRTVPSLVELCLFVATQKPKPSAEKTTIKRNKDVLPTLLRQQLVSFGKEKKEQQNLLSYILNKIFPSFVKVKGSAPQAFFRNAINFTSGFHFDEFCILFRTVWRSLPVYNCEDGNCGQATSASEDTTSFLYTPSLYPPTTHICYPCEDHINRLAPNFARLLSGTFYNMLRIMSHCSFFL